MVIIDLYSEKEQITPLALLHQIEIKLDLGLLLVCHYEKYMLGFVHPFVAPLAGRAP